MSEFEVIAKYFAPLTMGRDGSAGLCDDAAVVCVPDGHELVVSSDTLNEGVHFLEGCDPADIAHKALRVNLSDLAAMGAEPLCYQLNIAFPEAPSDGWLAAFTGALMDDQKTYGIYCSGGDTTSIKGGFLSVSITVMGSVPKGRAVRRGGAKAGDLIILSGAVGDAVLGLQVLCEGLERDEYAGAVARYLRPEPRCACASLLRGFAHAAIDISDGLLADLGHVAAASGVRAELRLADFGFSACVQSAVDHGVLDYETLLSGGDDYELLACVPEEKVMDFMSGMKDLGLSPLVVGRMCEGEAGVDVYDNNSSRIEFKGAGWRHF